MGNIINGFDTANVSSDKTIGKEAFRFSKKATENLDKNEIYGQNYEENAEIQDTQNATDSLNDSFSLLRREKGEEIPFVSHNSQSLLITLVIAFVLMIYISKESARYLRDIFVRNNTKSAEKQMTNKDILGNYILYIIMLFLCALVFYEILIFYFETERTEDGDLSIILLFWRVLVAFSIAKFILYMIYGFIFKQSKEMITWHNLIITSFNIFGVFAIIPVILLIVIPTFQIILLAIILIFFVSIQVYLFWRIFVFFVSKKYDFLYLIMYLCTVELIPYLFLIYVMIKLYQKEVI